MQKKYARGLAAVAALLAGGLAAFALRPSSTPTTTLAARNPAVEVRTQVIRRTIHIGHAPGASVHSSGATVRSVARPRTGTSGAHSAASTAVATRTSGSPAATGAGAPITRTSGSAAPAAGAPARTRTSGGATSGRPVTRSSGGGGKDGGDGGSDN